MHLLHPIRIKHLVVPYRQWDMRVRCTHAVPESVYISVVGWRCARPRPNTCNRRRMNVDSAVFVSRVYSASALASATTVLLRSAADHVTFELRTYIRMLRHTKTRGPRADMGFVCGRSLACETVLAHYAHMIPYCLRKEDMTLHNNSFTVN